MPLMGRTAQRSGGPFLFEVGGRGDASSAAPNQANEGRGVHRAQGRTAAA